MNRGKNDKLSPQACPEGMTPTQWQTALRRRAATTANFAISEVADRNNPGLYSVANNTTRRAYRAAYHGVGSEWNHCDCMDFRTNGLGTCKHLEAVALWLEAHGKKPVEGAPRRPGIYVDYRHGRRLRLRLPSGTPRELSYAAMRYFDDELNAVDGMIAELPNFIDNARRIDRSFHCSSDALNYILEERDRRHRRKLLADIDTGSVLTAPLYPYQQQGVRFAFEAGRCLIADEMGLGKTIQALGTAELLRSRDIISTIIVLCPTSLKYQWKKEIERFTKGATVTIVEGHHQHRRELYYAPTDYKIVSYHTLANDIKAMGTLDADMVIMDEVQRLKNWNTQISQAARRVNTEYAVVLSGTPLENKLDELYSVMQFVDQYALGPYYQFLNRHVETGPTGKVVAYKHLGEVGERLKGVMIRRRKAEVDIQLPRRTDKVLYVPMTREQSAIHDEAQTAVAQLAQRWQRSRFLSEKDRKRLLLLLSQMRMVCDSTFILDQKSRNDTKPAEAMQQLLDMVENGTEKAVVFSQWERMTRIMAEELDRAGIRYEYLHGGVPSAKRGAMIERFASDPDVRVFLSTDAGSTGLNLQSASLIINLDLPWNPAVLEQRIGRVYRLGQARSVQVINMVAAGTIEERMLTTLNFKAGLFAGIFDDGDDSITIDDGKLTRIVDVISEAYEDAAIEPPAARQTELDFEEPEESRKSGESQKKHESHESHESRESEAAVKPDRTAVSPTAVDAVIESGMHFLESLAQTLQSPEGTRRLTETLNTPATRQKIGNILSTLAVLLKNQ